MNSICQLSGAVWGGSSPLSLVRDATVHFRTGRKKKKKFGFSALLVCHTKAAFGGTADGAPRVPRATLVQPFPLSLLAGTLKAAQRRSSGYPEGAKECQNN